MKISILLILLTLCLSRSGAAIVSKDTLFLSPDKTLQANIDYHSDVGAGQVYLKIRNLQTNAIQECGPILTPVHSVLWSPDSKTIVLIQHMANGCVPGVAHVSVEGWKFSTIYLPIKGPARYSVTKVVFIPNGVRLTYRVAATKLNGTITGYELTEFDVNASDFSISKAWKKEIDLDTFVSLGDLSK
jgi:WD40 repeat protein